IHAIGDEAFRLSLDAVEAAERAIRDDRRPAARIEHGQTVHPADLARLRGRVVSVQPAHRADDALVAERALGKHRLDRFFPLRSMHAAGAVLAFGSDWPVVPETLSVEAALVAATANAAGSLGFDDAGVLAPGRRADVAVLDRDPFTADWLHDPPRVVATIAGGEIVFDRDGRFDGR
ncbi:MAG: amidohydrolase family protein, partial [Planctomycetota bacterium]